MHNPCNVLELYDRTNYESLQWPVEAGYERDFLLPLLTANSEKYVSNVKTELSLLKCKECVLPVTVNNAEYDNTYVCSPFTRYVTYASEELRFLQSPYLEKMLSCFLKVYGRFLKLGNINRAACINNWLLSTNLYPYLDGISIKDVLDYFTTSFSKHAIMFPSLNRHTNGKLMEELQSEGCRLIPARKVFIFDKECKDFTNTRQTQVDFALLEETPYQIIFHDEFTENDYERILELYYLLYINKYSHCNPKFSLDFIRMCHKKKLLNFQGLRGENGLLVGVIVSFQRNGVLATPLIGYDTALPVKHGLFRILTALSMKEALDKQLVFNMSAGVSEFKRWRGGTGYIEYIAVYYKHLPAFQRMVWGSLDLAMNRIGVPLLDRNQF